MTSPATTPPPSATSPYAAASRQLFDLGYHVIPLIPADADHNARGKAPGHVRSSRWLAMSEWQRFKDRSPSEFERRVWSGYECANAGIVLGTNVSRDHQLIAIDIDTIDPDAFEDIIRCLPATPMRKRGLKGETRFYRAPQTIKSRGYDDSRSGARTRLIDVLTGHETKQTVVPPSVHPDSRQAYVWLEGPVQPDELPVFDEDALAVLVETLEVHGYQAEQARPERRAPGDVDYDDNMWTEVKVAAMANLAAWVPDLNLYRCQTVRGGGYKAVATWRSSSTGRPVEVRKRNLSITSEGIRDFGADEGYTPIDLVMRALDYDQPAATAWLQERLGLAPVSVFEPAGNVTVAPEPERIQPPEELPAHLARVPGLVGDITNWIVATSQRPQPGLALASALAVVGTAVGRVVSGPTYSGTHLYVLALGPTGCGKNHGPKQASFLMRKAGLGQFIGASGFMSEQAIYSELRRSLCSVASIDEFGSFLRKVNSPKSSTHEQRISGLLRQLWGTSFETVQAPAWATRDAEPFHVPALSVVGMSTPEEFYASLTGADVENGLLNRFLLIRAHDRPERRDPEADPFAAPQNLIDDLAGLRSRFVSSPTVEATLHVNGAIAPLHQVEWETGHVKAAAQRFEREIELREDHPEMLTRTYEIAVRLATIRAVGCGTNIDADCWAWASELALWSANTMIEDAAAHMADNDHQRQVRMVQRVIQKSGAITRSKLYRAVDGRIHAALLESILKQLQDGGSIISGPGERAPGMTGKAPMTYQWVG